MGLRYFYRLKEKRVLEDLLQSTIQKSKDWMIKSGSLIDGINVAATNRTRVSISLHHLCIEYHNGIHVLIENQIFGSAFVLLRPQYEAYHRGAWFHFCADEHSIEKFLQGNEPPKIQVLIDELEKKESFNSGFLSNIKMKIWNNLNNFTHGGSIQVKARNTSDEIVQNYRVEHIIDILGFSAVLSYLAGIEIARVLENDNLAVSLREGYFSIYKSNEI